MPQVAVDGDVETFIPEDRRPRSCSGVMVASAKFKHLDMGSSPSYGVIKHRMSFFGVGVLGLQIHIKLTLDNQGDKPQTGNATVSMTR
jgi:hypothetical protein